MPKGGGSTVTIPNAWSKTIYMSSILGGGEGATITIRTSSSVQPGFSGPYRGVVSYVDESGEWVEEEFYSSITVHTGGDSAFEPYFKLGSSSPLPLTIFYDWNVRGSIRGSEVNSHREDGTTNETGDPSSVKSTTEEIIEQTSDTSNDILLKRSDDLTEDELKELMKKRSQLTNDKSTFNELVEKERQWFSARYGDEPVNYDETGKMIQPVPINPAPKERKPLMVPENKTMVEAIKQVADQLGNVSGDKTEAVRGLQIGINRTKGKVEAPLKTDGQFGPKSAQALKKAIAALGPTKIGEANVLGQFQNKVMVAKKSGDPKTALDNITNMVAPLLPDKNKDNESYVGLALQSAINDVNKDDDQIPKLKEDGIVGPITKDVFGMTAKKKDAKQLSDSFGHFLGFD